MSQRARELAEKLEAFSSDVAAFVENCSDEDWGKTCSGEGWPVNVVARHIAAGHYGALNLAKMIVAGESLPELTGEMIDQMNAQHAEQHTGCTKEEVLGYLRDKGSELAGYVAGLSDEELDRVGQLALLGGDVTTEKFIEFVILNSAKAHFENMKAAVGS